MFNETDIQAVEDAMRAYDATVEEKKWRELAVIAITAMGPKFQVKAPELDLPELVSQLHKQFRPEVNSDDRALDRICSIILGDEGYANWLAIHEGRQHD